MRPPFKLLTAAGLALCVSAAAGAILTTESSSRASSLQATTTAEAGQSSGGISAPVEQVRAVRPDKFTSDSCQKATWPYIPEECLGKSKPVEVRILK